MTAETQDIPAYPFDARGVAKRFRHAAIFGALEALGPGEAMRFVNDHDPLPLLAQLDARFGETLQVEYLQRSPAGVIIDFIRLA
ncbi:DUF2249 domain-containing protein [Phenylobacterium sp.]|uniref:DUF2249 domain-containing protein n=1 Tax=Phenylobacterium sp. TaxID=1871053 RepID=UPI002FE389D2